MDGRRVLAAITAGLALGLTGTGPAGAASPRDSWVTLDFDEPPGPEWFYADCGGDGALDFSQGILTIDSPTCAEFINYHHLGGEWHDDVTNRRGWVVEARVRLDPSSAEGSDCHSTSTLLWIHDHTHLVKVGLSPSALCLSYPEQVRVPLDTTDDFHVYRVEGKRDRVRVYVDGRRVITRVLSIRGDGTDALIFGDGDGAGATLSYWDYVRYTVQPGWQAARRHSG